MSGGVSLQTVSNSGIKKETAGRDRDGFEEGSRACGNKGGVWFGPGMEYGTESGTRGTGPRIESGVTSGMESGIASGTEPGAESVKESRMDL